VPSYPFCCVTPGYSGRICVLTQKHHRDYSLQDLADLAEDLLGA
jgi:hypothetical protein